MKRRKKEMLKHIIFGFHGIHTGSENWNDGYRRWLMDSEYYDKVIFEEIDFGKILAIQMYANGIISPLGWNKIDSCAEQVKKILGEWYMKRASFSFVSHSFGTWVNQGILWRHPDIKPKASVLVGSVLSSNFKKTKFPQIFQREQMEKLGVFWSKNDSIIAKTLVEIPPFGRLGSKGFTSGTKDFKVDQFETKETHTSYWMPGIRDKYHQEITKYCIK